ncbi:hypothetical protein SCANM63S_05949 [Streptomyces canarius]
MPAQPAGAIPQALPTTTVPAAAGKTSDKPPAIPYRTSVVSPD